MSDSKPASPVGSTQSSILGLITARSGSKGIPRKNLVPLDGNPLIQYTFEAALQSKTLDRVILTTDDEEIAELGKSFGIEVPFARPKSLATDEASTRSVQIHTLNWLLCHEGEIPEAVVTLQPTSPLRNAQHIDEAVSEFKSKNADSVIAVSPVREHPYEVVGFAEGRMFHAVERPKDVVRRQQFPPLFIINGAVYVTRSSVLMDPESGYGDLVYSYVMDYESSVDIDTPFDLWLAESLLRLRPEP